ncbi:type II secretion system protein J [Paenibacillus sp. BC26]|uniref:PulJ/GspJ family protein n=1 Tax=Paenibacillus sp. BC26 TaxID=1881032 RepID=UPI0008E4819E|nr:prepilin-type N-terminal cleavage/methylation domain-containing protein [Paenibacillus sp. BC26]SFT29438.1 prepilin-type N-terminal cleavage/methylation domain-containing protein [Paenibacillus sp. BC26]
MNRFVNSLRKRLTGKDAEGGYTLVELIASLTLLSVVLGVIYSSITFGMNTYNKVRVENSLRDEGDLIMSSIITELYRVGPSRISQSDASLSQSITLTLPEISSEDPIETGDDPLREVISIKPNTSNKSALFIGNREVVIDSEIVPKSTPTDNESSSITLKCVSGQTGCSSGMIEINLKLRQEYGDRNFDLKLESRFGF